MWNQIECSKQGYWHGGSDKGFGDRESALVFIGVDLTEKRKKFINQALKSALLTDAEMIAGKKAFETNVKQHPWKNFKDPFFGGDVEDLFEVSVGQSEQHIEENI